MSAVPEFAAIAEHLFSLKAQGPKYGIDRMRALAAALDHPERVTPVVHIAGTNGKGSVAAMLDAILRAAGWRTGLFTSPHLVHVGERVQVDRRRLTDREIIDFVRELQPVADRIARATPDLRPSFFEWMTAMAFLQFARQRNVGAPDHRNVAASHEGEEAAGIGGGAIEADITGNCSNAEHVELA